MKTLPKPPGNMSELKQLRRCVSDAWWRENDCVEGMKLASTEARLLQSCDKWLCWVLQLIAYCEEPR